MTTEEAAERLAASKPTVRDLIEKDLLKATREPRGQRFRWLVDRASVDRYLSEHGRFEGRRRGRTSRLERVEWELSTLREALSSLQGTASSREHGAAGGPAHDEASWPERDALRVQVINLQEALARAEAVMELQRQVQDERAVAFNHLLAAAASAERVDALQRQALAEMQEALSAFGRPGHPGEMA